MATEIRMPQFGVSMETGTIAQWLKAVGDPVQAGEVVATIETEKLTNDVLSDVDGVMIAIIAQEGDEVPIQGLMAVVGAPGEVWNGVSTAPAEAAPAAEEAPVEVPVAAAVAPAAAPGGRILATPFARAEARRLGVDLARLAPSGTSGRIRARDVYAWAEAQAAQEAIQEAAPVAEEPVAAAPEPVSVPLMDGDVTEELMAEELQRAAALTAAQIPAAARVTKVDVTKLLSFADMLNRGREEPVALGCLVAKAAAKVLREQPRMCASLDGKRRICRGHVNLAITGDSGLLALIRDADQLGLDALCTRYTADEAEGNAVKEHTFTVVDLSGSEAESFVPQVELPAAAALGIGCVQEEAGRDGEGKLAFRQVVRLCLSYDQRLLTGEDAARFQSRMRELLQRPMEILL